MTEEKSPLQYVSEVRELNKMREELSDPMLDEALDIVVKLTVRDIPQSAVTPLIVKLQASAVKFKMQAKHYMLYEKTAEGNRKKNVYLSAADGIKDVVDALKYMAKNH